jgi:hypothetical protein
VGPAYAMKLPSARKGLNGGTIFRWHVSRS